MRQTQGAVLADFRDIINIVLCNCWALLKYCWWFISNRLNNTFFYCTDVCHIFNLLLEWSWLVSECLLPIFISKELLCCPSEFSWRAANQTTDSFARYHHHSLKPKAFPNQDRERGGGGRTEGGSGAQGGNGNTKSNRAVVLQSPEHKWQICTNVETYIQPDWRGIRAYKKLNQTCRENGMDANTSSETQDTTAQETTTLKEWHAFFIIFPLFRQV